MKKYSLTIMLGSLGAAALLLGSPSASARHDDASQLALSSSSYTVAQYQEPPRRYDAPLYRVVPPPMELPPRRYEAPYQGGPRDQGNPGDDILQQIEERSVRQQQRIANGVRNGDLSRQEARRLEQQQRHIRQLQRRARADGVLTPDEILDIQSAQDEAGEAIRSFRNSAGRY